MVTPIRSEKYLAFVRDQPCAICSAPNSEAHHHGRRRGGGGMGLKTCDLRTVPLCSAHHRAFHNGTLTEVQKALLDETVESTLRAFVVRHLLGS